MLRSFAVCFFLIAAYSVCLSQSRFRKKKDADPPLQQQPNSLNPYNPMTDYAPAEKKSSKSVSRTSHISYDKEVKEFYKRKADALKAQRKWERLMKKPQYTDPTYFGHKHKPKKHPPGKMKYCKECGIWH